MNEIAKTQLELDLQDLYDTLVDYHTEEDGDYFGTYADFPVEENFCSACYYDKHGYTENSVLHDMAVLYGYDHVQDMLSDLYAWCDIKDRWNSGYYYNPRVTLSFGYYRIDEVEHQFSESITDRLERLSKEEIDDLHTDFCIDHTSGYIYLCGGVSFELSIYDAMRWLEENRKEYKKDEA
jgi:hypothetical protein